jgi:hypothetical protein
MVYNDHSGVTGSSAIDRSSDPRNGLRIGADRAIVVACSERQQISAQSYCRMRRASAGKTHGLDRNEKAPDSRCLARVYSGQD